MGVGCLSATPLPPPRFRAAPHLSDAPLDDGLSGEDALPHCRQLHLAPQRRQQRRRRRPQPIIIPPARAAPPTATPPRPPRAAAGSRTPARPLPPRPRVTLLPPLPSTPRCGGERLLRERGRAQAPAVKGAARRVV